MKTAGNVPLDALGTPPAARFATAYAGLAENALRDALAIVARACRAE